MLKGAAVASLPWRLGSAAGKSAAALRVRRGVVELVVVVVRRFVGLRQLLAVKFDVWRGFDLILGDGYLHVIGTDRAPAQWHKGQVAADQTFFHRGELRLLFSTST